MEKITKILIIFAVLISIIFIIDGNEAIKGAAIIDFSQPIFNLNMDQEISTSQEEVSYYKGVYAVSDNKGGANKAWNFDGKTDYVITSSTHLKDLEEFTIMFWMKPSSLSLLKRAHMLWQGELDEEGYRQFAGNGWGPQQELHLSLGDEIRLNQYLENKLTFYFGDENNNLKISAPLKYVDWQHVAVTVKNLNEGAVAELYLDGTSVGKATTDNKIKQDKWEKATLYLGKAEKNGPAGDSNRYFEGVLDELAIYGQILSPEKIFQLCRRQNNGNICGT